MLRFFTDYCVFDCDIMFKAFFPFMSSNYHKTKEATCSQESVSIKNGNRKCNHHCKNKETCGHDCCEFIFLL